MVEYYIKTVQTHLRKVAETTETGMRGYLSSCQPTEPPPKRPQAQPASVVSGRKLDLPCNLLFGAPPDKEQPTTDYMVDLMEWLHDIHHYDHQHLKVASNHMNACYNHLVNSVGFQERDKVWLYHPTQTRRKFLKSCSHPGKALTRWSPGSKMQPIGSSIIPGRR
jgi:hypothetical protein